MTDARPTRGPRTFLTQPQTAACAYSCILDRIPPRKCAVPNDHLPENRNASESSEQTPAAAARADPQLRESPTLANLDTKCRSELTKIYIYVCNACPLFFCTKDCLIPGRLWWRYPPRPAKSGESEDRSLTQTLERRARRGSQ